ncbi:DUF7674 family protein [Roseivirga echinicomitans]|uniref:DUF7674 domain-containing protein n=1 Tax=Roseivirga echinicomitans TaxID=296218 RepID=A0A150X2F9_9BACT|nr:hypothetical protein [Roseivirga echinicomitans]KYG72903.1 hypothetical protein AWN68_09395 [Roseivirga echinicomitans]
MKSENWIDVNDDKMGADRYFELLVNDFPMIRNEIQEEDSDMIHMRMECFADYTIKQIKGDNDRELKRCFDFQESKIDLINSDLENALIVSYCESMLLGEVAKKMDRIVDIMPDKLRRKYLDYEAYYNKLGETSKKRTPHNNG